MLHVQGIFTRLKTLFHMQLSCHQSMLELSAYTGQNLSRCFHNQ